MTGQNLLALISEKVAPRGLTLISSDAEYLLALFQSVSINQPIYVSRL